MQQVKPEGRERPLDFEEKRIDGEVKYEGVIVTVRLDRAQLHNGKIVRREVVEHPGGVTVLPVDENGVCTLVRQFRYPFGRMMLEAPAGKLERGEDVRLCAERELSEETGYTADEIIPLHIDYSSPAILSEIIYIYLAKGLHGGKAHLDEGEFLSVERYHLSELVEMVMRGEITDGKTQIAILKTARMLGI
jgi:ADP-ribose pyrophosphatase